MATIETFERERRRLVSIAYRMLGSLSEAEDVVQDAFLRWRDEDEARIESPAAFLTTIVTRLCLDVEKSARVQRETYVGPWLPEPVGSSADTGAVSDPSSISLAFLVVLESLSPLERAAFLLSEVFDHSHAEIATILGRDEATCRKLASRARAHVAEKKPRFARSREEHERMIGAFLIACSTGDVAGLSKMLASDVSAWSDGGGRVSAARKPVFGVDHVARFAVGLAKKGTPNLSIALADVNGWPTIVVRDGARVYSVIDIETDGEQIFAIRSVLNPEKLQRVS